MKNVILIALALIPTSAFARANTQALTCAQASGLVQKHGKIVLGTADGIYAAFVAHSGYCDRTQTAAPAWVPTRDSEECFIGYVCAGQGSGGVRFEREVRRSCKEGSREVLLEQNPYGDGMSPVQFVCRAGKWERLFGGGSTGGSVRPIACREGKEEVLLENNPSGDSMSPVIYVCRSGKWIRKY